MTLRLVIDRYRLYDAYDEDDARRRVEEERDERIRVLEREERADEHGSTGWHMAACDVRVEAVEEPEAA